MAIRLGSWGTPELGVSEWLQSKIAPQKAYAASGGSNLLGATQAPAQTPTTSANPFQYASPYNPPAGNVLGTNTYQGGGSPAQSYTPPGNQVNQIGQQNIEQQMNTGMDMINRDYEVTMGALSSQEEGLRGQAGSAITQAEAGYAPARTQIANEQATNVAGIQGETQTAETQAASALQQARDVFRQTQQQNIAQMSGLGISSSSVAEALAERLGVETARRIAGVTGSLDEVRQNAAKELTRVNTYYQSKLSDLETQLGAAKSSIQQQLLQGISQINQARNQAASDKANQRAGIWQNAQNALAGLAQQAQSFQQSLDTWKAQQSSALTPVAQDPNYVQNLIAQAQNLNSKFTASTFIPQFSYDKYGNVTGRITGTNRTTEEDELQNPFQ